MFYESESLIKQAYTSTTHSPHMFSSSYCTLIPSQLQCQALLETDPAPQRARRTALLNNTHPVSHILCKIISVPPFLLQFAIPMPIRVRRRAMSRGVVRRTALGVDRVLNGVTSSFKTKAEVSSSSATSREFQSRFRIC